MKVDGRCHCGQIRFQAEADPKNARICHCTDCQRLSGGPYRTGVPVRAESFTLQGEPTRYVKTAASGTKRVLAFCPTCGSPIYACALEAPTAYVLRLFLLDQQDAFAPKRQIWRRSAAPWVCDLGDMESFDDQGP
ncbi:MAG TPA: GFA family protein [Caulobacteraceae bacterium]|nr:GFA family protein [Caulobacteraceae bacterium]